MYHVVVSEKMEWCDGACTSACMVAANSGQLSSLDIQLMTAPLLITIMYLNTIHIETDLLTFIIVWCVHVSFNSWQVGAVSWQAVQLPCPVNEYSMIE